LKRIERDLPKIKKENTELGKKVRDLEILNAELEQ